MCKIEHVQPLDTDEQPTAKPKCKVEWVIVEREDCPDCANHSTPKARLHQWLPAPIELKLKRGDNGTG